jgi:rhodanese-related sulfurtransferase
MKQLSVKELALKLQSKEPISIIDVREPYEFEMGNLGANLIPLSEVLSRLNEIPKHGTVVIHCRSGSRASAIIHVLETEFNYTNLFNLEGGILAWAEEFPDVIVA